MSINNLVEELKKIDLMEREENDRGQGLEPLLQEFVYDVDLSDEDKIRRTHIISDYYNEVYNRTHGNVERAYTATRRKAMKIFVQHWAKKMDIAAGLAESHSRSKCMDCSHSPTVEVRWAEGMGHAWFCAKCFAAWKKEHKGDIDAEKKITDGMASKNFSDNKNPNVWESFGPFSLNEDVEEETLTADEDAPNGYTEEMIKFYEARTLRHIARVQAAAKKLARANILSPEETRMLLLNIIKHDASKFEEPEYTPYISLTWRHKLQNEKGQFDPMRDKGYQTPGLLDKKDENEATLHHVRNNSHHPEYWLENSNDANIDPNDRNRSLKVVDASRMPKLYLAEMVADWWSMSEELGTNTARQWFDKNRDVRWHFSDEQVEFIDKCLRALENDANESVNEDSDHSVGNYGYVYKTTNLVNGKIYIGQRKGVFNSRYIGSGYSLRDAVKEYGFDNFKVELLAYAKDQKALNDLEISYIAKAREMLSKDGYYNLAGGGQGGPHFKGGHHTPEFKANMSGEKNVSHRPDVKAKIIAAISGDKNHMRSQEMRARMTGPGNPMYGKPRPDAAILARERNLIDNPAKRPEVKAKAKELWLNNNPMKNPESVLRHVHSRWHVGKGIKDPNCKFCAYVQESLLESAIDFPTDDLPKAIWDKTNGKYCLKQGIKDKVIKYIKSYPGKDLIDLSTDIHICGSLATNLYTSMSDFDVHMVIDKKKVEGKEAQEELTKKVLKWSDENPKDIEGYPCHIYMQDNENQEYVGDSLWDLNKEFWAKGPKISRQNFNPYTYYREILIQVEKKAKEADIKIGELSRSVIDYASIKAAYKKIPKEAKASLRDLMKKKLAKIEDDIEALSSYRKEWAEKRRSSSQPKSIEQAVTSKSLQKDWTDANAIFKYLTKYDYITTIKALEDILDDDGIADKDVDDIKKVLDIKTDFEKVSPALDKKEK